jgi:hypothetical protein
MIPLYAIMRDYVTIMRDYFTDNFTDFFYRLYAIVLPIIRNYFMASAPRKWECADSNSSTNHEEMTG